MENKQNEIVNSIQELTEQVAEKIRKRKIITLKNKLNSLFFVILGAVIMALGLEYIVIPNGLLDGGITGISIMLSKLFGISVGTFLLLINLPFVWIGYKKIGKTFAINTAIGIGVLSITTTILHNMHVEKITDDLLLATILGGIVLGIGVGLVIKSGGSLDGTEISALILDNKVPFSVGQIILVINVVIFSVAITFYSLEVAVYSLLTYFIASKAIDIIQEGLDTSKSVYIISDYPDEMAEAIQKRLGRGVTFLKGRGGYSLEEKRVILSVITRLEEQKLKTIVSEVDDDAFVIINNVSEVKGGNFKKNNIH